MRESRPKRAKGVKSGAEAERPQFSRCTEPRGGSPEDFLEARSKEARAVLVFRAWGPSIHPTDPCRLWQAPSQALWLEESVVRRGSVAQCLLSGEWWADLEGGPVPSWDRLCPSLSMEAHRSLSFFSLLTFLLPPTQSPPDGHREKPLVASF